MGTRQEDQIQNIPRRTRHGGHPKTHETKSQNMNQINAPLLIEVKEQILQHPDEFNMNIWLCDTMACIGGWALLLANKKTGPKQYMDIWGKGIPEDVLGLIEDQGKKLFYENYWPKEIKQAFSNAQTSQQRAKIAAKRIDLFIATNGEQ
jgi:hypothetical protein